MTNMSRASCVRSSSMLVSGAFKGAVNIPNFGSYTRLNTIQYYYNYKYILLTIATYSILVLTENLIVKYFRAMDDLL